MCDVLKELQHSQGAAQLERMISKHLNNLVTSLSPKNQEATLSTLKRIFNNIIQHPNDDKYRQIKLTDETFTSKVWQYPAGKELMKMSGWEIEGDHVTELRLRDDSCVQNVSQLLKSFLSSATSAVPFPDDEFQVLIEALYNGDIACIQKLLKVSHISHNGRIYSESGSSLHLLEAATIGQQLDIVKLLLTNYSMDPYAMSMRDDVSLPYIEYIFCIAPQSFIIAIMKYCGIKTGLKTSGGRSLLHYSVWCNCFHVVSFLLEECSGIDVNVTIDYLYTPLHVAYLYGHTQMAEYLIQHDADVYAVDSNGHTPYEYIDGHPDFIKISECIQNRRKIHHIPYSTEHCYYMKLINIGINDEEAVSLTMNQFPSLKEDGPTQPHHDIDHASALKEFTQYITYSTHRSTDELRKQPPSEQSEVQGEQAKISTDYAWKKPLSLLQRAHVLF